MTKKSGGFWGFIKRIFGFGSDADRAPSFPIASDEEIDAELNETYEYDEEKNRRDAEEMIAKSFEEEKTKPDDPDVFFQRATGYSILNENEKALEILDKIISVDSDYIDAYRLKAGIYEDSEDYEQVVENLSRAISLHADRPADEPETDFGALSKRIANLPDDLDRREKRDDYENRGAAYFELKNFEAAIDDFTNAIRIEPDSDYLFSVRGEAFLEAGNPALALQDLNKAIELGESYYSYAKRAKIHQRLGNYDAALRDISTAIELNDASGSEFADYFDGHFERAEIHMEKGDYHSAVEDFTTQIEITPTDFEAHERRAVAYRSLGMESHALADEQKAAELCVDEEDFEVKSEK